MVREHGMNTTTCVVSLVYSNSNLDSLLRGVLLNNSPSELAEGNTTLGINQLSQVWLGEYCQGVSGNSTLSNTGPYTLHEMWHSLELALSNPLQRLSSLESNAVPWDLNLDSLAIAVLDIQTSLDVRRCGKFWECWKSRQIGRASCRERVF